MKKKLIYYIYTMLLCINFSVLFAQNQRIQSKFEGTINGKFPISLSLIIEDNLVEGTLIYKKVGIPIKIVGSIDNGEFTLNEFDDKTQITGTFTGELTGRRLVGYWFSPSGKQMSFLAGISEEEYAPPRKNISLSGNYAYNLDKDSGSGSLYVQQISPDKLIIEMQAVGAAPAFNQAIIEKTEIKVKNNVAYYENTTYGNCKLKISFSDNGASVIYLPNGFDCGFGNAVSVIGNYLKYDNKNPKYKP